ncbi:MAG: two-component sensor histidine kinase, partial [Psychrobacter sp.]|nr:two-component sensor histidine kinase [Psychrobacter sp.]
MTKPNPPPRRRSWLARSYSNTWLTTLMVSFIVLISVSLSILFFWRSLYLPELKNHARYLTSELRLMISVNEDWKDQPEVRRWVYEHSHVVV